MSAFLEEAKRFLEWADSIPIESRGGEWELDYPAWDRLYQAAESLVQGKPFEKWSTDEIASMIYVIARDNEDQRIARRVGKNGDDVLLGLVRAAVTSKESGAKWQLAVVLPSSGVDHSEAESVLLALANDPDEYVRRRVLGALAEIHSPSTERIALDAWDRADEQQEYSRMMSLSALQRIRSPHFVRLRAEAIRDQRPYLASFASKLNESD